MGIFNRDGALVNAFSAISNSANGLGGSRDPLTQTQVSPIQYLGQGIIEQLYIQSIFIQKVVDLLPVDSASKEVVWKLGESNIEGSDVAKYVRQIEVIMSGNFSHGLMRALEEAGTLGRLYGDGYIVMGIDDGRDPAEPVDEKNIKAIRWLAPRSRYYVYLDEYDFEHYRVVMQYPDDRLYDTSVTNQYPRVHYSRVLRIPGKRLPAEMQRYNGYHNDSVIQALYSEFVKFVAARDASANMLTSHSLFKYKLKGLQGLLLGGKEQALQTRFQGILMGMATIRGLIFDADKEDAEFINRSYSGVDKVLSQLVDIFVAAADMPRSKIFNASGSTAFSTESMGDRYEWAAKVDAYRNTFWKEEVEKFGRYIMLSKEGPTGGVEPDDWSIEFPSIMQLTRQEEAELRETNSVTDERYWAMNAVTSTEVRDSRFGAEYSDDITIDPNANPEENPIINGKSLPMSEYEYDPEVVEDLEETDADAT